MTQNNHLQRLDRYLKNLYPYMTQGLIESSLRKGHIKVDGKKIKASDRIDAQSLYNIFISPHLIIEKQEKSTKLPNINIICLSKKLLTDHLIFEHSDFIAINKPYNLATQSGSKLTISVDDALKYLNLQGNNFKLVHRLDKSTSGILLIAKSASAASKLSKAFENQLIDKTYYACVSKAPAKPVGQISSKLAKVKDYVSYEKVQIDNINGKLAITDYELIKSYPNYSLIKFEPKTGRMHQLRVHAQQLHCSIIGDIKYGGIKHKRLFLHAKEIILPKEIFGKRITITINLPKEFTDL